MQKRFRIFLIAICLILISTFSVSAQTSPDGIWTELAEQVLENYKTANRGRVPWIQPDVFRVFTINELSLENTLRQAPHERLDLPRQARPMPARISLPTPEGDFVTFEFVESPIMAPALAARYPNIKTYSGRSINDLSVSVRFGWNPSEFHAQVLAPGNTWYIDTYFRGESYACYYKRDYHPSDKVFECLTEADGTKHYPPIAARSGDNLREFRLVVACTGEYGQFHGGSITNTQSAIVSTINKVSGIYEKELAIRLILVDSLIYLDPTSDHFTNDDIDDLIDESQTVIDSLVIDEDYDIGHTFSTGGGGLAHLGSVCQTGNKARGVSGSSSPTGDPFDVDYVAHEIGHQFGANHTFNALNPSGSVPAPVRKNGVFTGIV